MMATIRGKKTASTDVHFKGEMTRQEDDLDEILSDESSFYGIYIHSFVLWSHLRFIQTSA